MTLTERKTSWTADEQREHRKIWVAALRSGKYQQAQGALRAGDGFCCLGVACDISGLGDWAHRNGRLAYLGNDKLLPLEVRDWLGLRGVMGGYGENFLTDLNDDEGVSFPHIADLIESEPAGLLAKAAS